VEKMTTTTTTTTAMIHSKKAQDEVKIVHENGCNEVIAQYQGKLYTAVFNPFVGLYYVDDIYGEIPEPDDDSPPWD
jgi:hypothetical protein